MPIDIQKDSVEIALKKLKAREDSLRKIEAISRMGSWEIDLLTHKSIWSDQSFINYGLDKATTKPTYELFWSHIVPEDVEMAQSKIQEAIKSGEVVSLTCHLRKENGEIVTLLINGQAIKDGDGKPIKLIGTTQDITEQMEIKEQNKELYQLVEYASNEIYILDAKTLQYLYVNKGACEALGYTKEELLEMHVKDINPFLENRTIHQLRVRLIDVSHVFKKTLHKRKDGSLYHVRSYLYKFQYEGKEAIAIFSMDISETIELELQNQREARILNSIHDAVIATDREGKIMSWNGGSHTLFGYSAEEMLGKDISTIYSASEQFSCEKLFAILNKQKSFEIEGSMITKNHTKLICDISLSVSKNEEGKIDGYIGFIQDITKQKETQKLLELQTEKLEYQAYHDVLTDLPNRALFKERLSQTLMNAKREKERFALLFIDLDHFKNINDTLGHDVGDAVLIESASRMESLLREEDTLARLGGDEFTIIIKNIANIIAPSIVANKIINSLKQPMKIFNNNLYLTTSIGISIYPDDAMNTIDLLKFSDSAMYKAKGEGRDCYQYYASDMTKNVYERVVMENSIRIALKEDQFVVYYQPQYDIKQNKIVGMEALVRWMHPQKGIISPDKFIPLSEETGAVIDIDRIVMQKAMQQFALWYKKGLNPGVLSLNLGMKQLHQEDYLPTLFHHIEELSFNAKWLEIEVTEGQIMKDPKSSIEKLQEIHNLGIEIAIDDFGTGYSSLAYLKKLPLDKLKIDKSFVDELPNNEEDVAIAKSIIALGKSLNFKLIAEGVENVEQRDFLKQSDCDMIQGYFYSKPLSAQDMEALLQSTI